jgi:O-methyltransferase domain
MMGVHGAEAKEIAAAYDFSDFTTIVDVGGATGHLLTTILNNYPGPRGILYDLPHVVRDAPELIQACGLTERVAIEGGSFFEKFQAGAMPIFSRVSFMTGAKSSVSRSSRIAVAQ